MAYGLLVRRNTHCKFCITSVGIIYSALTREVGMIAAPVTFLNRIPRVESLEVLGPVLSSKV